MSDDNLILPQGIEDEQVLKILKDPKIQEGLLKAIEQREAPLKQKRDELLGQQSKLSSDLKELGGIEKAREAVAKVANLEKETKEAELKALHESGKTEDIKKHYQAQLQARTDELASFKASLVESKVKEQIGSAIRTAGGVPELLSPHVAARVRGSLKDDGSVALEVLSASGAPMLLNDGKSASLADLIAEFKNDPVYGVAYSAPGKSGSGSKQHSNGSKTTSNVFDKNSSSYNVTEQMKLMNTNPELARQLGKEAGLDTSKW